MEEPVITSQGQLMEEVWYQHKERKAPQMDRVKLQIPKITPIKLIKPKMMCIEPVITGQDLVNKATKVINESYQFVEQPVKTINQFKPVIKKQSKPVKTRNWSKSVRIKGELTKRLMKTVYNGCSGLKNYLIKGWSIIV